LLRRRKEKSCRGQLEEYFLDNRAFPKRFPQMFKAHQNVNTGEKPTKNLNFIKQKIKKNMKMFQEMKEMISKILCGCDNCCYSPSPLFAFYLCCYDAVVSFFMISFYLYKTPGQDVDY
jgi:hypothetical protein